MKKEVVISAGDILSLVKIFINEPSNTYCSGAMYPSLEIFFKQNSDLISFFIN